MELNTINQCVGALEKELRLRRYCASSIKTYTSCIRVFLRHFRKHPELITLGEMKEFLITIKTVAYHKQMNAAIHRFYEAVVGRPIMLRDLPYPRNERRVPEILTIPEVTILLSHIHNLKHRAIIQLIYSCALRIGEVVRIKIHHLNRSGVLRIEQAKGKKDGMVPVPEQTMNLLREYFHRYHPKEYLFNGQTSLQYDIRSIQQIFHRAVRAAGIRKKVSVHTLRHSRATHLLDLGVDLFLIQKLLRHSSIRTTAGYYLHTSVNTLQVIMAEADKKIVEMPMPAMRLRSA